MAEQITEMTHETANRIGEIATQALRTALAEYGVEVKSLSGRYDPTAAMLGKKWEFTLSGGTGKRDAFARDCSSCFSQGVQWLAPEDYERVIDYGGRQVKLTGLNWRARRYAVEAVEVATGKGIRLETRAVERIMLALKQAEAPARSPRPL